MGEFLGAESPPRSLLLRGEAGIGKTTIWEAGVGAARSRGWRVLSARPNVAEERLAFCALGDLLDEVGGEALGALAPPQRRALEVALLRAEPDRSPPDPRAIAVAFLNVLRALAAAQPLLIAVDDVQHLDPSSADALAFAGRRLGELRFGFLLARRPGGEDPLGSVSWPDVEVLELGPLSLGATRRLLFERLELTLARRELRRIFELSLGNPLFALELGRLLRRRGIAQVGGEPPMPRVIEDLLGSRLAELPAAQRRLLLAIAICPVPSLAQLADLAGDPGELDAALDAGVLVGEGDRVRAAHPLLASVAAATATARELRSLHRELAEVASGEQARARHLALATTTADRDLAAKIAAAAGRARARGDAVQAVELAEHALRLTPADAAERGERVVVLADHTLVAGHPAAATRLLGEEFEGLPRGAIRARAHLLLAEGDEVTSASDVERHIEAALAEARGDAAIEATALGRRAEYAALCSLEGIVAAEAGAERGLRIAGDTDAERLALNGLGWTRILRGRPVDDLCRRFDSLSDSAFHLADSPHRLVALRHLWRGELADARAIFDRLGAIADERAEPLSYVMLRTHCCELAIRGGAWDVAAELLDEWEMDADRELVVAPAYQRCRALLAAGRGHGEEADRWATEAEAAATASEVRWELFEARRARGLAALLAGAPRTAVECMAPIWERMAKERIEEPGAFPVAPDLVEALLGTGDVEGARAATARLRRLARRQRHPWALAGAARCEALSALAADGDDGGPAARLEASAAEYERLGLRFDAARSLLALGRAQRRRRQWRSARDSLGRATAAFDSLGSPGWAERAREALAGIGGRRPRAAAGLTPAERRTAELAAQGLSNKEIAQASFIAVGTVESHLSRAYAKLGVRSRAQLGARLPVDE